MNTGKKSAPKASIRMAFDTQTRRLSLDQLIPVKIIPANAQAGEKYKCILASIQEVGIIEPLVVTQHKEMKERYLLLDGHLRWQALRETGATEAICLLAHDDEAFTYNRHVNRLSPIQEHRMITEAVRRGVSEEKIARALHLDVSSIVKKRNLLEGICAEAVELLKEKMVAAEVFSLLRKMKPYRQIEAATLMNDASLYTVAYAKAILGATPQEQLLDPATPKKIKGLDAEQMARMETEMAALHSEYHLIEESFGKDMLTLTLARNYLITLLGNPKISRYLVQQHPEILVQFQKIADMTTLGGMGMPQGT